MQLSRRKKHDALKAQLDLERSSFIGHWRDLGDHIFPRRPRFTLSDANRGERKNQKIIDSTATLAARTLRSGMMSGVTPPSRPWFRLTTPDPKFAEMQSVKEWLSSTTSRMATVMLKSNLYNKLPIIYGDAGVFGTAALYIEEDFDGDVIRCEALPIGSYSIGTDSKGKVRVFTREFRLTVRQIVEQFCVVETKNEKSVIVEGNVSEFVKTQFENGSLETWVDVCHVLEPNWDYKPEAVEAKHKKYRCSYYERGTSSQGHGSGSRGPYKQEGYLFEGGYDYFPVLVLRWETTGEDVYGTECPGMASLGDTKQLQVGERKIAQAIEKMVNPPMTGPTSLQNRKVSILPGDITYVDAREGQQGFRPAHEVNPRIAELEQKQGQIRQRIARAFFEDLFLMLANSDRRQITAREIEERHEEKLLALGPVLEQLNQDLLDPLIDIIFMIMERQGMIEEAPEEVAGVPLKIEYISIMAQAQKLIGIAGIERLTGFVGQIAQFDPRVLDKVDADQIIDEYAEALGVSPKLIRSDDAVAELRGQKAKAEQAQTQAAMIQQAAGAARDLSQTSLESDNALTRMIDQANVGNLVE